MSHSMKLLASLALGGAAALINWMVLAGETKPTYFVTVRERIEAGQTFDLAKAEMLPVPSNLVSSNMAASFVPFTERGSLSGRVVKRDIEPGDPVFYADTDLGGKWFDLEPFEELYPVSLEDASADARLMRVGNQIRFRIPSEDPAAQGAEWIGPFRIVAVGSKINNHGGDDSRGMSSGSSLSVSIAYNAKQPSQQIVKLQQFCDLRKQGKATLLGVRIVDNR